jgi:membrane-associated phospholipid phosphatase
VSSPSYSFEKRARGHTPLTRSKRIFLLFLVCCIQTIYLPASNRVTGGLEPKLPIDVFPVWTIWILPYVLCYVLWFVSGAWIIIRAEDRAFRSFLAACMLTFSLGVLTFIFFPTYVKPAALPSHDMWTALLRIFHEHTGRYAALPSGHVYITTLLALFFSRWYPRFRALWILIVITVSLSTLFTGQHYILDVLAGYLVAFAGYYFGLWWVGSRKAQKRAGGRSDKRIPSSSWN